MSRVHLGPTRFRQNLSKTARDNQDYTFTTCTTILESLRNDPGRKGQPHSRGSQPGLNSILLGGYSHGNFSGVCNRTVAYPETVQYINSFMRQLAPMETWTSLQISYDITALPHRDHHNLKMSKNILVGLGNYQGGQLWVHGDPPDGLFPARRLLPDGSRPRGYLLPTYHQVAMFSPDSWHATQKWTGHRVMITAYTTRMTPWMKKPDLRILRLLGFPLPDLRHYKELAVTTTMDQRTTTTETTTTSGAVASIKEDDLPDGVDRQEYDLWKAKVAKRHKAAGHPTARNLARIIEEAGHPKWKALVARNYKCETCASLRPGGTSSGQIPPASTHASYSAWEAVAVDAGEWVPPNSKKKINFLLFMDVATKLRVIQPLETYDFLQRRAESSHDFMKAFAERWIGVFQNHEFYFWTQPRASSRRRSMTSRVTSTSSSTTLLKRRAGHMERLRLRCKMSR